MSKTKQTAVETVHTFMKYILFDKFDEAGKMIIGDVDAVGLPTDGENATIIYSILDAEEERDMVFVPVDLEMGPPEDRNKQTISFACVETEDGLKIDMDMTLKKTMGASPGDLLESMKEDLESIVEEAGSAFENIPQDDPAPELYSPDHLSNEFREGLSKIEDLFDKDLESISDTQENEDLVWQIAWGTMCDDELCPQRLLDSVISPLRSALAMLGDHRGEDPNAAKDASIQKIRASIKTIRILNVNDYRLCECSINDTQLTLTPCLRPTMDHPRLSTKGFTADQIEWSIRDALDLDVGPAIKRSEAAVAKFVGDCEKDVGFTPQVTVDWESFRTIADGRMALDALKRLRNDLFISVLYALFHLKKKVPFDACLKSIHFGNVKSVNERSITVDGMTITFSVPMVEASTCYTTEEVQEGLAVLVKELPLPPINEEAVEESAVSEEVEEPEVVAEAAEEGNEQQDAPSRAVETPASAFQQMVRSMESDMMGPMRAQMSQLFAKDFGLEVDWDSMDQDQDHFTLVVSGALGAVMGALMVMAYDSPNKEPVIAAVGGIALRYDPTVRGVALSLDDGVLKVVCGGPASQYAPDPAAMGEVIMTLIQ